MKVDEFWDLIEAVRAGGDPFAEALADRLASGPEESILEFQERFDDLDGAVCRWDVWAAAHLIGGGCSDDAFADFRAGLIALGREWYERAADSPDSLADHPEVVRAAQAPGDAPPGALFDPAAGHAAAAAFQRVTGGGEDDFYQAYDDHLAAHDGAEAEAPDDLEVEMGEEFDFDDADEMRLRLPRLAALFLESAAG